MQVRLMLTRSVVQYADVVIEDAEGTDDAKRRVATALADDALCANLLRHVEWYDGKIVKPVKLLGVE